MKVLATNKLPITLEDGIEVYAASMGGIVAISASLLYQIEGGTDIYYNDQELALSETLREATNSRESST